MLMLRRIAMLAPLLLVACGDDGPARTYAPLRYDYLTPLQLNVASIDIAELPPPGPLDRVLPVSAAEALRQMALDRLCAAGSSGKAVVTIDEAQIMRKSGGLDGVMAMHLDIFSADGTKAGFAQARVVHRTNDIGSNLRSALYDITKQMLDDMNVELEFQIRRSLRDYLQTTTTAPAPAPVEQQNLPAPAS